MRHFCSSHLVLYVRRCEQVSIKTRKQVPIFANSCSTVVRWNNTFFYSKVKWPVLVDIVKNMNGALGSHVLVQCAGTMTTLQRMRVWVCVRAGECNLWTMLADVTGCAHAPGRYLLAGDWRIGMRERADGDDDVVPFAWFLSLLLLRPVLVAAATTCSPAEVHTSHPFNYVTQLKTYQLWLPRRYAERCCVLNAHIHSIL